MNLIELIKYKRDEYHYFLTDPKEIIIGLPTGNYCTNYKYNLNSLILIRGPESILSTRECITLDKLLDLLKYTKKEILYHDKYIGCKGRVYDIQIENENYYKLLNKNISRGTL